MRLISGRIHFKGDSGASVTVIYHLCNCYMKICEITKSTSGASDVLNKKKVIRRIRDPAAGLNRAVGASLRRFDCIRLEFMSPLAPQPSSNISALI